MSLKGKTAIVTGASRGIGLAVAQRLVADGAHVVITGRKQEALDEAVATLGGRDNAMAVAGNAADGEHRASVVAAAVATYGSVDLLVNNTGINPIYGSLLDVDSAVAAKMVDTNVLATIAWVKACSGAWMRAHGGAVVNVSSVAGLSPSPGIGWYGATKAMLSRVTAELAVELAPEIRVNAVAPAVVKTKFAGALYEGREDKVAASYPLKRLEQARGRRVPRLVPAVRGVLLDHGSDHHHRRWPDPQRRNCRLGLPAFPGHQLVVRRSLGPDLDDGPERHVAAPRFGRDELLHQRQAVLRQSIVQQFGAVRRLGEIPRVRGELAGVGGDRAGCPAASPTAACRSG